jgi:uncharacterized protein YkwD
MARVLRVCILAVLSATLVLALPAVASACRNANLKPAARNADKIRTATRCLVNVQRRTRGLAPLRANRHLRRAAQRYSRLMVTRKFFSHVGPGGSNLSTRIRATPYLDGAGPVWFLGENLAWARGSRTTPRQTVNRWMRSTDDRAKVLDRNFRDIGIGVSRGVPTRAGGRGATYAVVFGRR